MADVHAVAAARIDVPAHATNPSARRAVEAKMVIVDWRGWQAYNRTSGNEPHIHCQIVRGV